MTEDLVTATEAATILGVDKVTIHRYARKGKLPTALKGDGIRGARWFHRSDVEALADEERAA